jgi:hypothetical protein
VGVALNRSSDEYGYLFDLPGHEYQARQSVNRAHLTWQSDTTDDPFTPRGGRRIRATLSYEWGRGWSFTTPLFEPAKNQLWEQDFGAPAATVVGSWFLPLTSSLSLGLGASLHGGETRDEAERTRGESVERGSGRTRSASGSLDVTLLGTLHSRPGAATHCWWELTGSLTGAGAEGAPALMTYTSAKWRSSDVTVGLILALRGRWGIARLGFSYQHGLTTFSEYR